MHPDKLENQTLLHYRIYEKLGQGGMGIVYRAEDLDLERIVALKVLVPSQISQEEAARERFLREARAAAKINHPNITTIYSVEQTDDLIFFAMEYLPGQTLGAIMRERRLSATEILDYAQQITAGLSEAHHANIVHRDLKPDNFIIGANGLLKIMDFGLARLPEKTRITHEGFSLGTASYMSPEQISNEGLVDFRSDIFSFGSLLFEMCCGYLPFQGDHDWSILYAIINSQPEPFEPEETPVPPGIEAIIQKCLHKNPAARWQSAAEIQDALAALIKTEHEVSQPQKSRKWRHHMLPMTVLLAVMLLLTSGWFFRDKFYSAKMCNEKAIDALLDNDVEKADLWLKRAIKKQPNFATAWSNLALVYFQQAQWARAVQTADQALALDAKNVEACFIMGRSLEKLDQPWAALNSYQQVIAIDSSKIQAYNDAAWVFLNQNQPDSALELLSQSLGRQSDSMLHAYTHKNMGLAYWAKNQPEQAITHFELSLQVDSTLSESREYLSQLRSQEEQ